MPRSVNMYHQWPVTKMRIPVWPPQPQVMSMNLKTKQPLKQLKAFEEVLPVSEISYLDEYSGIAMPHNALDPALWALLEPGPQLLEIHRWRISYTNTSM